MTDLINQSGIKKRIREKGFSSSAAALNRFDEMLANIIDEAIDRAKKNNRKTVMPQDI